MTSWNHEKKDSIVLSVEQFSRESSASIQEEDRSCSQETGDEIDYPDGGSLAWRQVVAGHFINAIAAGYPSAFGVFQLYYTDTLALPASDVSWIGSVQTFLNFLICFVSGRLCDAGYAKESVLAGSFLVLVGTFVSSLAAQYWMIFLFQGVCTGIGLGLMYSPGAAVVSSYFDTKRSLALGISTAGTATGSVIFPAVVQYLSVKIGFAWALRCVGFIVLAMVAIISCTLRPRPCTRKTSAPIVELGAFKEVSYVLYALGAFMFYWAFYIGFFYVNTYAMDVTSFTPTSAVNLLIVVNALGIPSRPLIGFIADRYLGALTTFTLSLFSLAIVLYSWVFISTPGTMYVFAVLFGITSAASQTMFIGALASLTKDSEKVGTRLGMCCFIIGFATLSGPPIASMLINVAHGRYLAAQIWAGSVTVVGAALLAVIKWRETGRVFTVKF